MKTAIVVGAGITGVSAAEWMRREGWEVTLVDRIPPGDPGQASYGNAGLFARAGIIPVSSPGLLAKAPGMLLDPGSPLFMRWSYLPRLLPWLVPFLRNSSRARMEKIAEGLAGIVGDSVDQHLALAAGTGAEAHIRTGYYTYLYPDRAAYEADALGFALRRRFGFDWDEAGAEELREELPGLGAQFSFAAKLRDHGWLTSPGEYVAALARHFAAHGGTLRRGDVVDVAPGRVTLDGGEALTADRVVLSAGVWSRRFAEALGHKVPLEAERGYHLLLKGPSVVPPYPVQVTTGKFVATPMAAGLRCAGIVEFGGTEAPASEAPLNLLRKRIAEVYPGLSWEAEETWLGFRPSFPDSLPMIGESPRAPGVILAFGGQHLGLTMGPRLGRMAADFAAGRKANIDMAPYAVDRFDG